MSMSTEAALQQTTRGAGPAAPASRPAAAAGTTLAERSRLRSDVALAARILAANWPIDTFIAVNPAGGLENRPFGEAVTMVEDAYGANGFPGADVFRQAYADGRITDQDLAAAVRRRYPALLAQPAVVLGGKPVTAVDLVCSDLLHGVGRPHPQRRYRMRSEVSAPAVADLVDAQAAKWSAAYLDSAQASWMMPGREKGFYGAWRDLAALDRSLPAPVRSRLRSLPYGPEDAAIMALRQLRVPSSDVRAYLTAHLTRLPGWAAQVNWRGTTDAGLDVLSYLAMRLSYEAALLAEERTAPPAGGMIFGAPTATPADSSRRRADVVAAVLATERVGADELAVAAAVLDSVPVPDRELLWLDALEFGYRDQLLRALPARTNQPASIRPAVQLVCCIDVRSEGLRRRVEEAADYETFGFAGFFAVAIRFRELSGGATSGLCPVLLKPRNEIAETPLPGREDAARRKVAGARVIAGAKDAFHAAKDDVLGPFALAEAAGWVAGPVGAAKTLAPGPFGAVRDRLRSLLSPPAPTALSIDTGFTVDELVMFGQVALTMMGLTGPFGRLVVLSGHGSTTENNPYASALDCGACGGNRGAPNARTAAAILNRTDVRDALRANDIAIPADTVFVAAEHDTAVDRVELLDQHLVPPSHYGDNAKFAADLAEAGAKLAAERSLTLPGARRRRPSSAAAHVRARSTDWAQVFPEWGLAGNAAFIVGPRTMTRGVNLQRRTFLHSYDADVDPDGSALETILTAPLVVAQWINCQYYFSTVDQGVFGSGTKTVHNVVSGVGVLSGHNGDLRLGLPWQSVSDGKRLLHEPMRLFAVVQAPQDRIDGIIQRNTVLQNLFHNDWVALAARDTARSPWNRYTADGWVRWSATEEEL